jgi:hypothetical protein
MCEHVFVVACMGVGVRALLGMYARMCVCVCVCVCTRVRARVCVSVYDVILIHLRKCKTSIPT